MIKIKKVTDWDRVYAAALRTEGKETTAFPSDSWKRRMLIAEHSPIRLLEFDITFYDIPYFVAMHLVRHFIGCIPFVSTQRTDRTGIDRNKLPQDNLISMQLSVNAQALIYMSRKRLCSKASPATRKIWNEVKDEMKNIDPIVAERMLPECAYRHGFCPEMKPCGTPVKG